MLAHVRFFLQAYANIKELRITLQRRSSQHSVICSTR